MAVEITDAFGSDTSANYALLRDADGGVVSVSGGELHVAGYKGCEFRHTTALSLADHYVQADVEYNTANNDWSGLIARSNNGYGATVSHYALKGANDTYTLYRVVDGAATYLAAFSTDEGAGSLTTLKMTVSGTGATVNIVVTQDGTERINFNDTDVARIVSGLYAGGIVSNSNNGSDVRFDNFEAGTAAVSAAVSHAALTLLGVG